ncbi:hypothetical protein LCGC14_2626490 [marine sediment metagenome]|uniref:Uncharacterized protein n=1 Tax=marine sediment metagenome TaxID=412755 RepID=A0A0F9CCL3_9ZZZZ
MPGFNDYAEDKILDHAIGGITWTAPTTYLALWIGDPTETGAGGAEVSAIGTAYVRVAPTYSAASGGSITNSADIDYPQATAGYGTVTHGLLADNVTPGGGNPIMYGPLTNQKTIDQDDQFRVLTGDLVCTLD